MALSPKLMRQTMIWLVISIAVVGLILAFSDVEIMRSSLASFGAAGWVTVLLLSTLNFALRFARWQYYLTSLGHHVPVVRSAAYFLAGFAFTSTPAKAGEAVRSLYLKREGVGYTDSLSALFVERLTDLIAVILLALAAAYSLEDFRWLVIVAGLATLALLPLIHSRFLRERLDAAAAVPQPGKLHAGLKHLSNLLTSSSALLRSGPLYGGMLLSILATFAVSLMMYVVLVALGVEISLPLAIGIYATGILAGALSFLPGGIGSAEAVMIGLLVLAGVELSVATAATLICRIAAMWYSIAVGIVIVLWLEFTSPAPQEAV